MLMDGFSKFAQNLLRFGLGGRRANFLAQFVDDGLGMKRHVGTLT
jgi:hypothetical protein